MRFVTNKFGSLHRAAVLFTFTMIISHFTHVSADDEPRELSPLPPFHFWPRFQPEFLGNTYKASPNSSFYAVKKDPLHSQLVREALRLRQSQPDHLFTWVNPKSHIKFWFYSRKNRELAQEIVYELPSSVHASNFNPQRATKVIIHGFADGASEVYIGEWILRMRDAYLDLADLNIIVVDYSIHARIPFYVNARPELVGARVGEMVRWLVDLHNTSVTPELMLSSFHLIGWSWGAHVAGFAGTHLHGKLGRITGLDPAGPTFRYVTNEYRLDAADAQFVDVIHTNSNDGTTVWGGQLGLKEALGHVDVYVNGGHKQTGCPLSRTLVYETLYCSHGRVPRYWTESIQSPLAFPICRCDSFDEYVNGRCNCTADDGNLSYMGEHQPVTDRGVYQLITRALPPYGHGPQMKVSLDASHGHSSEPEQNSNKVQREAPGGSTSIKPSSKANATLTATIKHENETHMILLQRDPYGVDSYSNTLLLNMSLQIFDELGVESEP